MASETLKLPFEPDRPVANTRHSSFKTELDGFREFGQTTRRLYTSFPSSTGQSDVPTFVNEFWTSKQRAANNLHEISYRACFKPQLPRFFIDRLTCPGELVYDPF